MEIKLLQRETPVWLTGDIVHKQVSFHAETVVPDTAEDAQEIVWTKGGLLLKGKEPGLHAVTITGEAWASIFYLSETGKLECIRLRKDIEIVFDAETAEPDALPHLSWYLSAVQGRLLNPRKLGVSFEVQAVVRSFQRGTVLTETALPEGERRGLHILQEQKAALVLSSVSEKPFTLREQLPLSDRQTALTRIDAEELRFDLQGTEQIGSRCIVKGELRLLLWGRNAAGLPANTEFRISLSQLLDITEDTLDQSSIWIEPNSVYLDWTEGSGEARSLDLELHALLQFCALSQRDVTLVTDAYSSAMPLAAESSVHTLLVVEKDGSCVLSADAALAVPDDLAEMLASEAKLGALERSDTNAQLPLYLDFLYRRADGSLAAARRSTKLSVFDLPEDAILLSQRVKYAAVRREEGELRIDAEAEILWHQEKTEQISTLSLLTLDEESAWKKTESPSVYLVRRGGESLWDLAKDYRSSVDLIRSNNPEDADLLLIPAEI